MKTLDKYLLWAIAYIVAWSVVFFISWIVLKMEPTVLEGCILAPGVVEMVACAYIKRGKKDNDESGNEEVSPTETDQ